MCHPSRSNIGEGDKKQHQRSNQSLWVVKWKLMYKPKNLGRLGIIDTSVMNKCLIIKWWWRIFHTPSGTLWLDILKAKYFPDCSPMFAPALVAPRFGVIFLKLEMIFNLMSGLWWAMGRTCVFGSTGGVVILLYVLLFWYCFLTVRLLRFLSQTSLVITRI